MTLDEITKRVIVPKEGLGLDEKFETVEVRFAKKYKQKPVKVDVTLEAIWRRAVNAALALAMQPLERCDDADREAAFLAWCSDGNELDVERVQERAGETSLQAIKIGRLAKVQGIYDTLCKAGPSPAQRVLIAYANLLCRNKQVPTVKEIQDEIIRDGKARGERYRVREHSGVRFILDRAELPMRSQGWQGKKQ